MLPFRHIVFPIDYSAPCQAIVPYIKDMTRHFSADLTLVHASGLGLDALGYTDLVIADADWPERSRAFEEKRLRQFASEAFPNQHVELIAEVGEPGAVIHKVVQHHGADLVMLPTHGLGPVRRLLLGSVTAKVLHDVNAAVWTGVHTTVLEHQPAIPYKSILCALDSADEGELILRAAATIAERYGAQLSLVHAVETPPASSEFDFRPYKNDLINAAHEWIREMKGKVGVDAPLTVVDYDAPFGIRQTAIEKKADLIVTGRGHSQNMLSRIWSHLYPIIRESPVRFSVSKLARAFAARHSAQQLREIAQFHHGFGQHRHLSAALIRDVDLHRH